MTVHQDFKDLLPLQLYTNPFSGDLNLAANQLVCCQPTDLGPKAYVAYGTMEVSMTRGTGKKTRGKAGMRVRRLLTGMCDLCCCW